MTAMQTSIISFVLFLSIISVGLCGKEMNVKTSDFVSTGMFYLLFAINF